MDFAFSPDQDAIRDTARRFARDRLVEGYQAREVEGKIERSLILEMGRLGLIGADLPEMPDGVT